MQHAMTCFARLVRALLGEGAIAERKLECGATLVVLGISVTLGDDGFSLAPAKEKASMCIDAISEARSSGVLRPACAEKLAGRLSWATQYMFYRVGRAMIRPIFDQRFVRDGGCFPAVCVGYWGALSCCDCRSNKRCSGCSVEVVAVCVGPRRL